jgi:heat-inducible transcriptional repressor
VDARKRQVLRAVVDDYVVTAEPVASRTLARKYPLGVSAATIRNELADLESEGYLLQPHVSAGRIPSDKGYRYYVDRLMVYEWPSEEERVRLAGLLRRSAAQTSWLLRELGQLLAEATHYASVVLAPVAGPAAVVRLGAMPLDGHRSILVLVTDRDFVVHRTVERPGGLDEEGLEALVQRIGDRIQGVVLTDVGRTLREMVADAAAPWNGVADVTLDLLAQACRTWEERVILGGTSQLLGLPEFQEAERVRQVLEFLDHPDRVQHLLEEGEEGVQVRIGTEHGEAALVGMSVVSTALRLGHGTAYVAVLGPTRMAYGRVMGTMGTVWEMGSALGA